MKKLLITLLILFTIMIRVSYAQDDYTHIAGEDFFNSTVDDLIKGENGISIENIINTLSSTLTKELKSTKSLILSIFVIAFVAGILNVMKQGDDGAEGAAFFTCFCLMTIAVAKIIEICVGYGTDAINEMCLFITKLLPMLSVLLVTGGYTACAASFYPVFSGAVWFMGVVMDKCIVPLIYIGCVTGIINTMSSRIRLNNFNKLIKLFSKWILAGALTLFSGVNAIYGFCTPTIDSVGMKTAKFAIGSIIPVVGGFLAESMETVISGAHLIKNAVGTAGIISLITICALPAIKLAAAMIMIKLATALIEPVSDTRFCDMLNEAGEAVTSVFAAILIVLLLFVISLAIVIASTNVTM